MNPEYPDVYVTAEPAKAPGALYLFYVDPCEWCGHLHSHGNPTPNLSADGSYGYRTPHCPDHPPIHDGRKRGWWLQPRCEVQHPSVHLWPVKP